MRAPNEARRRWPRQVRRRDGSLTSFDGTRIERAVERAARESGSTDPSLPQMIASSVMDELIERHPGRAPQIEEIQDLVERHLMLAGLDDVARSYVAYRRQRAEIREAKARLEVRDDLKLGLAAVTVLRERFLLKDDHGRPAESTGEMMDRAASHVAGAEDLYRPGSAGCWSEEFSRLMRSLDFLPNSPTLMNAGTRLGLLSGCVVLPVEDSLASIFASLGHAALVHQAGGGTGYSFSHVRPAGDHVATTGGTASGPVSFLHVFDAAAGVIRSGGRRRGASMGVLDISHPDIGEFITAKRTEGALEYFNLSVGMPDSFLRAVEREGMHRLVNPRTGRVVARLPAVELFELICESAHDCGDPGVLFLDAINRANPLPGRGRIEATNPCGEVPLLPHESCNLGSINVARFTAGGAVDWQRLTDVVHLAVRFLDDVIDVSRYPFPELEDAALASRKVGLGIMGLAELLASLRIPYDSDEAVRLGGRLAGHIRQEARRASAAPAHERGPFPPFAESTFARKGTPPLRNAQLTSVAPTGTISLIAGTTAGIEPMFAIAYARNVLGRQLVETNALFDRTARDLGFYTEQLAADIAATGRVRDNPHVPADVRAAFPTALDLAPEWHLRMQAAIQRHVDAAVSKTINLPAEAAVDDVRHIFLTAWRAKVKGITIYRYGSKAGQVLTLLTEPDAALGPPVRVDTAFAGGCAGHACEF
jgi:ribonucleoside-diphosphate reductase alpha chain